MKSCGNCNEYDDTIGRCLVEYNKMGYQGKCKRWSKIGVFSKILRFFDLR